MSAIPLHFVVEHDAARLDRLVCDLTGLGRRLVRGWFEEGRIRVDGRIAAAGDPAVRGSEVVVEAPLAAGSAKSGEPLDILEIVAETLEIVVIAKPAGLHSERGRSAGSVAELLEARFGDRSGIGDRDVEAGLVHRLDRDTSGALVAAKTREAWRALRSTFSAGRTFKQYLAIVGGEVRDSTRVELPLVQRGDHVVVSRDDPHALAAATDVEPLDATPDWSLVLASMRTGVMHQVRCHLAALGHPLVGDAIYGGGPAPLATRSGHLLHALRIRIDGHIDATVRAPRDFIAAYAALQGEAYAALRGDAYAAPRKEAQAALPTTQMERENR